MKIKYQELFLYRNVWMGFAILWIIFYHSVYPVNNYLLWMFKNVGYCGVDLFFFASGIGCCYSFHKDPDVYTFMKKRLVRIIPTYWIFLIVLYLIRFLNTEVNLQVMLGDFLCLQYFHETYTEQAFNWYICGMWVMYLVTPYFYSLIQKHGKKSIWVIPFLLLGSVVFWHSDNFILTATRLPVFFLGMYYEKMALEQKELTKKSFLLQGVLFLIGFAILVPSRLLITDNTIMWGCGVLFYPFMLMTPFVCIVLSLLCRVQNKLVQTVVLILGKAGRYSLELYLVHHLVFETGVYLFYGTEFFGTVLYWLVMFLMIVPITLGLHKITKLVCGKLNIR